MELNEFQAHPVWGSVESALTGLAQLTDLSIDDAPHIARVRELAARVLSRRDDDPTWYSTYLLDPVNGAWSTVSSNLANHLASPTSGYLAAAASSAEQSLVALGSWPEPEGGKGGSSRVTASIREANRLVGETLAQATAGRAAILEANAASLASMAAEVGARDEIVSALRLEVEELRTSIARDKTRLDSALTGQQESFLKAQQDRSEEFEKLRDEARHALKSDSKSSEMRLANAELSAREVLDEMTALREQVEKTTGSVVAGVLAKDYSSYSMREFVFGLVFYFVGFGLLGISAIPLVNAVIRASEEGVEYTWQAISLKLALTAAAGGLAAVAIRIGSRFLSSSAVNKRVDLELRALGPLLADIADEKVSEKAKIDFVERMFGRAWDGEKRSANDDASLDTLSKLVSIIVAAQSGKPLS